MSSINHLKIKSMKLQLNKLLPVGALLCLVLASCKKMDAPVTSGSSQRNSQLTNTTGLISLSEDEVTAEASDMLSSSSTLMQADTSDCKTVTYDPSKTVYPHTTTVHYGSGCTQNGKTISGKRVI